MTKDGSRAELNALRYKPEGMMRTAVTSLVRRLMRNNERRGRELAAETLRDAAAALESDVEKARAKYIRRAANATSKRSRARIHRAGVATMGVAAAAHQLRLMADDIDGQTQPEFGSQSKDPN